MLKVKTRHKNHSWGSTTKLVLPWFPTVVEQAHVQPSRRQSGLVLRDQLTAGKAELNPVEVNRKALAELNQEEVNRRSGSGFNQFQLDALSEHNICRARHGVCLLELS